MRLPQKWARSLLTAVDAPGGGKKHTHNTAQEDKGKETAIRNTPKSNTKVDERERERETKFWRRKRERRTTRAVCERRPRRLSTGWITLHCWGSIRSRATAGWLHPALYTEAARARATLLGAASYASPLTLLFTTKPVHTSARASSSSSSFLYFSR